MTREEHMEWCKKRAREYLDACDPEQAITSMISDLGKHDETAKVLEFAGALGLMALRSGSMQDARKFIEGFN